MVLLPKGDGNFRGIGLLEVPWKVCESIINARLRAHIDYHDCIHGFRAKRGCDTALIETKIVQELAAIDGAPLYCSYVDLHKAYDSLDHEYLLEKLEAYGVGQHILDLLSKYWDLQQIVAQQSGFHVEPFKSGRGIVQGSILSPELFNIISDAVIRHWLSLVITDNGEVSADGFGATVA